jgi:hypothetical protein
MKIIKTNSFNKISSDLKDHPTIQHSLPSFRSEDSNHKKNKKKKKKKLPQMGLLVDDVSINDLR